MCQYSKNCRNFQKHPVNSASCSMLCTRNPLLNYEIPDFFKPIRMLSAEESELEKELEFGGAVIISDDDDFNMVDIMEEARAIDSDPDYTDGEKKALIQDLYIKRGVTESFGGEMIDTTQLPPPRPTAKKSGKKARENKAVAKAVQDSVSMNAPKPEGDAFKAPKRRKKSFGLEEAQEE